MKKILVIALILLFIGISITSPSPAPNLSLRTEIYKTGCQIIWIGQTVTENESIITINCTKAILIGRDGTFEDLEVDKPFDANILKSSIISGLKR